MGIIGLENRAGFESLGVRFLYLPLAGQLRYNTDDGRSEIAIGSSLGKNGRKRPPAYQGPVA